MPGTHVGYIPGGYVSPGPGVGIMFGANVMPGAGVGTIPGTQGLGVGVTLGHDGTLQQESLGSVTNVQYSGGLYFAHLKIARSWVGI